MAVCEGEAVAAEAAARARVVAVPRWAAIALALGAAALFAIRLDLPGFFDNEGRYAEVAREMVVGGDWISPHLDFALFLNKPPLTFWLTALVFRVAGPTEWARLVPIAAAALTLFATCRLGALLYGELAGLLAGVALATTLGFVLEARTLRPDMLLTASVVTAIWCWHAAERSRRRQTAWLLGLYAAVGLGMVAKGFVPVVLAGMPIAIVTLREHGRRGVARLRPALGLAVVAAIVMPWHLVVALRHPGFAWDYIVNQHLLFFLARKLPHDSTGDPLWFFWAAFLGRGMPWSMLLPLTLAEAVRGARGAGGPARATFRIWVWAGALLAFFSLAPSRLEHYSLPALPAVALLAARVWQWAESGELSAGVWAYLAGVGGLVAFAGTFGLVLGGDLLARTYWLLQTPGLLPLAEPAAATLVVVGVALVLAATRRRPAWLVGALALGTVPMAFILLRAEAEAEPLFSWRPVARAIASALPPDVEVVFEAPEEYQLVGGLAYYAGRRIALLEPPGYVPPTYLVPHLDHMFQSRADFERRWRAGERLAFVSDPQRRREEPDGLVPPPVHVVGRFGDRWLLASFAPAATR